MTNSNFQTPLTLNSHKSCLKNYRIKNYHIFGISRTSAFIWHPWIPLENFCIGVIGKNAKKYRFCPFSVSFSFPSKTTTESRLVCITSLLLFFFLTLPHFSETAGRQLSYGISGCTSWKFLHWSNWQKCEKIPFLTIFRVPTVKKSKRPSFGQFWSYRTCP